jgi:uncharacterized protein (UPF0212 family)
MSVGVRLMPARRVAKSDIGGALKDVPLKIVDTIETGDGAE